MSIGLFGFGGLASGLDSQALIRALVDIEARPARSLETRKRALESRQTLFTDLDSKLDALDAAVQKLATASSFQQFATTSSDESVVTATATGSAQPGTYTITVTTLATQTRLASQAYADTDTLTVGTGTLSVTVGTTPTAITIDSTNNTLGGVAQAISASAAEVTAEVINVGGGQGYKLVVSGNETGLQNAVTIDVSGLSGGSQPLSFTSNQAAGDASFSINGLTVQRPSNTITDVIQGVTLSLLATGSNVSLDVATDADAMTALAKDFVKAYNDVASFIEKQLHFEGEGSTANPLLGDFTVRSVRSDLQAIVQTAFSGTGTYDSLPSIGFSSNRDGTLSLDEEAFEEALVTDLASVVQLFTSTDGVADRFEQAIDAMTDPLDGFIASRRESTSDAIRNLDRRIEDAERRLDQFEQNLVRRFAALEELVGQLQAQGQTLTSFLFTQTS